VHLSSAGLQVSLGRSRCIGDVPQPGRSKVEGRLAIWEQVDRRHYTLFSTVRDSLVRRSRMHLPRRQPPSLARPFARGSHLVDFVGGHMQNRYRRSLLVAMSCWGAVGNVKRALTTYDAFKTCSAVPPRAITVAPVTSMPFQKLVFKLGMTSALTVT
jgi:hypothetical protein